MRGTKHSMYNKMRNIFQIYKKTFVAYRKDCAYGYEPLCTNDTFEMFHKQLYYLWDIF